MKTAFATAAALALSTAACTDTPDATDRNAVGASMMTAVDRAQTAVDLDFLPGATPKVITGTRDSFTIGGTIANPWHADETATISGSGGISGGALETTITIALADWRDDFFGTTTSGTLELAAHATYRMADDPLPDSVDATVTGTVHTSGAISGDHAIDITVCYRNIYAGLRGTTPELFGWQGTVDGKTAEDHFERNDPTCQPL